MAGKGRAPKRHVRRAAGEPSGGRLDAMQIVDLLLPHVKEPGDERRTVATRIRKWLEYSIKTGKLRSYGGTTPGLEGKTFDRNEVLHLARRHKRWKKDNRLRSLLAPLAEIVGSHARISDAATDRVIPGSLERCQQALRGALDENERLNAELERLRSRLAEAEGDAAHWKSFVKKSGRRSRKE